MSDRAVRSMQIMHIDSPGNILIIINLLITIIFYKVTHSLSFHVNVALQSYEDALVLVIMTHTEPTRILQY